MYEKTKIYNLYVQIVKDLKTKGVDPFISNKYWVNDPTEEYGYYSTNLYAVAFSAIKNNLYYMGCNTNVIGHTATIDFALNLDGEIKQSVYDMLKKYPLPDQVQYAFYEGHITFKQYNQLMKKAQEVKSL